MTTRANRSPANDGSLVSVTFKGVELTVKTKFKIFKFMRMINEDPIGALALALTETSLEAAEEIEMDFKDFEELINLISETLSGGNLKN